MKRIFLLCIFIAAMAVLTAAQTPPNAAQNGSGKVSICKTVDDDWNCVGGSDVWQANKGFDVLFKNPTPVGVDFIGIVFFKQGPDGKDVEFVNEYQQQIGEKNRMYATVNNEISLPMRHILGLHHLVGQARPARQERQLQGVLREVHGDGQTVEPLSRFR